MKMLRALSASFVAVSVLGGGIALGQTLAGVHGQR